jgi:hypothetical protein
VAIILTSSSCCLEVSCAVICRDLKWKLLYRNYSKYFLQVCKRRWILLIYEWLIYFVKTIKYMIVFLS